jgi:hypothetical protein
MNIDEKLDLLKQIKEVDTPPFLFTRIRAQINSLNTTSAPAKLKWAFALTCFILVAINVSLLLTSATNIEKKTAGTAIIVMSMNLSTQNDLYNE